LTSDPEFVSGMLFYEYCELSHEIINEILCACARITFKENKKESPDEDLIKGVQEKRNLALQAFRASENFSNLESMSDVIHKFTPILNSLLNLEKMYW